MSEFDAVSDGTGSVVPLCAAAPESVPASAGASETPCVSAGSSCVLAAAPASGDAAASCASNWLDNSFWINSATGSSPVVSITDIFCAGAGVLTGTGSGLAFTVWLAAGLPDSSFAACPSEGTPFPASGCPAAAFSGAAAAGDADSSFFPDSSAVFCESCPASRFRTCAVLLLLLAIL